KRAFRLVLTARNRGHQQNFISIAKSVSIPAEEADIFFVDVYVQKTRHMAVFVAEMRLEIGELLIDGREDFVKIRCRAGDISAVRRHTRHWINNFKCEV